MSRSISAWRDLGTSADPGAVEGGIGATDLTTGIAAAMAAAAATRGLQDTYNECNCRGGTWNYY